MGGRILICLLGVLSLAAGGVASAEEAQGQQQALGDQAKKAYETAMSPYRSGNYQQAQGLLEEFIKMYPTHESVPLAYIQLAKCQDRQKNVEGYDATLEQVLKRFPGSATWFVATSWKLSRLKALKKNDDYLATLEALSKTYREIPMNEAFANADIDLYGGLWYYRKGDTHRVWAGNVAWNRVGGSAFYRPGLEQDLVDICDTGDRAERALKFMDATIKKCGKAELSPNWEFAHYRLLKKAGRASQAAAVLQAYKDDWGPADPRGLFLLVLIGEDAQQNHDDATADKTYDDILKRYGNFAAFAEIIDVRLNYLRQQKRFADWTALAGSYLKAFPYGRLRDDILRTWIQSTIALIAKGDANTQPQAQEVIDAHFGGNDTYFGTQWRTEVALANKDYAQAAQTAQRLADDKYWCNGTYGLLGQWAGRNPALKKVLEDARTKYVIPLTEANSPANALLAELKDRAKEEQVRHMEEIGKELLEKYPNNAATVEGVKFLVDYYFGKVLPEPRDRWIAAMIASFPRHPLTQAVMQTNITSLSVAKQYQQQLAALRGMLAAFPGVVYECPGAAYTYNNNWYNQCLTCFDALHDATGRLDFVQKNFAAFIARGDHQAIEKLVSSQIKDPNDQRTNGRLWLDQAKAVDGTRAELYCLQQACEAYYPRLVHERRLEICRKEGLEVIKSLQEQKIDPELRWHSEFLDVMLLADRLETKKALDLLDKKLTAKKYRDLSERLDFELLYNSVRQTKEPNQAPDAWLLGRKIDKLCYTSRDLLAVRQFLGRMAHMCKADEQAFACFKKLVDDCPWPAERWGVFSQAMDCTDVATLGNPCEEYMARIPRVQEIVPRVMLREAQLYLKPKEPGPWQSLAMRLKKDYPASESLAELQAAAAALDGSAKPAR